MFFRHLETLKDLHNSSHKVWAQETWNFAVASLFSEMHLTGGSVACQQTIYHSTILSRYVVTPHWWKCDRCFWCGFICPTSHPIKMMWKNTSSKTTGFSGVFFFGLCREIHFSWMLWGHTEKNVSIEISPDFSIPITWARWNYPAFQKTKMFLGAIPTHGEFLMNFCAQKRCTPFTSQLIWIFTSFTCWICTAPGGNCHYWGLEPFFERLYFPFTPCFSTEMLEIPYFLYGKKTKNISQKIRGFLTTPPSADPRSETPSLQKRLLTWNIPYAFIPRYCESPNVSCPFLVSKTPGCGCSPRKSLVLFFVLSLCLLFAMVFLVLFHASLLVVLSFSLSAPEHKIGKSLVLSSTSRRRRIIFPPHLLL